MRRSARSVFALIEAVELLPPDPLPQQGQESAAIIAQNLIELGSLQGRGLRGAVFFALRWLEGWVERARRCLGCLCIHWYLDRVRKSTSAKMAQSQTFELVRQ